MPLDFLAPLVDLVAGLYVRTANLVDIVNPTRFLQRTDHNPWRKAWHKDEV